MPVDAIERAIGDACAGLASSAATARHCHEHSLDGRGGFGGRDLAAPVAALAGAHPWALGGFGDPARDGYRPDPHAAAPGGLGVGLLRWPPVRPLLPAVARFAAHGHVLISERGFADGARS